MTYLDTIKAAQAKTSGADAVFVAQEQGVLPMDYLPSVQRLDNATIIMGHCAKQVRTGQVTHSGMHTGYAEFQSRHPGYYTVYDIPLNPVEGKYGLTLRQTTAGSLEGEGEVLVDYDNYALLVIESTYHIGIVQGKKRVYLHRSLAGISPEGLVRLAHAGIWPETVARGATTLTD